MSLESYTNHIYDSAHAQIALKTAHQNILTQDPKALPEFLS